MGMLYRFKEVFSLRNEIGTCPNKEVEIEVVDKTLFFIRPYHVREEDKQILDKEMKRLCDLDIFTEVFFFGLLQLTYINKKKADKGQNLAFPLVIDMFTMIGTSKCEVSSAVQF